METWTRAGDGKVVTDPTPFGCWGDHCPWCGQDWKRPHDPDCERLLNPEHARAVEDEVNQ